MIRKWLIRNNRKTIASAVALFTFVILMTLSAFALFNYALQVQEENEYKLSLSYHSMIGDLQNFTNQNVSLLSGFSAYIQMKDVYTDREINTYLNFLLKDHFGRHEKYRYF